MPATPTTITPARKPPTLKAGSDRPNRMKATATPGSTAWLSASPNRLMRRSVSNTPSGALLMARASVPIKARRMNANSWNGEIAN